jgi:SagB-type dehydrogenase family enzyme
MAFLRPAFALACALLLGAQEPASIKLPPAPDGGATLAAALKGRATARTLSGPALSLTEASILLWAAQGENRPGHRTVPSAHAKYPLEVYILTSGSPDLASGLYRYVPAGHQLARVADGTPESLLGAVKGMQPWIKAAPVVFVMAGDPSRIGATPQALALTFYEGGAAAQDLLLQASALGLGAGTAAGVDLEGVARTLKLPAGVQAMTLLPVGRAKP